MFVRAVLFLSSPSQELAAGPASIHAVGTMGLGGKDGRTVTHRHPVQWLRLRVRLPVRSCSFVFGPTDNFILPYVSYCNSFFKKLTLPSGVRIMTFDKERQIYKYS